MKLLAPLIILLAALPAFGQKVLVCTDPSHPLQSVIPADVREACDIGDVVITTHLTDRAGLEKAAALAAKLGNRIIVDQEHRRTALDAYLNDRPAFGRNLADAAADVKRVRRTGLTVAVYDKCPARNGCWPRESWTVRKYADLLKLERRAFQPDVELLEAYTYLAKNPADTFDQWVEWLDYNAICAELQNPGAPVWVLICPWQTDAAGKSTPTPDDLYRRQVAHILREGWVPVVFNPGAEGWNVVRELAPKAH